MFKKKIDTYLRRAGYTQIKKVGFSVSQWLPCPLAIWVFALDGNLVKCSSCLYVYYCIAMILFAAGVSGSVPSLHQVSYKSNTWYGNLNRSNNSI